MARCSKSLISALPEFLSSIKNIFIFAGRLATALHSTKLTDVPDIS